MYTPLRSDMSHIDGDFSGAGVIDLGGDLFFDHFTVELVSGGGNLSRPTLGADDHLLRFGFIAFGYYSPDTGHPVDDIFWLYPIWLNFEKNIVLTVPNGMNWTHIRYWFSVGVTAHIFLD